MIDILDILGWRAWAPLPIDSWTSDARGGRKPEVSDLTRSFGKLRVNFGLAARALLHKVARNRSELIFQGTLMYSAYRVYVLAS